MSPIIGKIICFKMLVMGIGKINSVSAQSNITAIDILLDPDQTMLDFAKVYNGKMQQNYSGHGSYSLYELHKPHITVLKRFVRTTDLDKVHDTVAKVVNKEKPAKEKLTAKGLYYFPYKNLELAGITIEPFKGLLNFQSKIIDALRPFIVVGINAAFVQNTNGDPIETVSDGYINGFIPDHSEVKYNPHVTIELAEESYLKPLLAKPFNKFTFTSSAISIYQLGDFGTVQKKLWTSAK
jgi:hypothetical protein